MTSATIDEPVTKYTPGRNWLGKELMRLRTKLREK